MFAGLEGFGPLPRRERLPAGFRYEPDFLSAAEERELLGRLAGFELREFRWEGYTARRLTASFGLGFSFSAGRLVEGPPVPACFEPLIERVADRLGLRRRDFPNLLLTQYPPGAVIGWHRDAPPCRTICGVSLGSDCRFRLRPHEPGRRSRETQLSLPVERRSLYVMSGAARSDWQHSIAPVPDTRYSITLRTLRSW